jgi:hypothetical protein
MREVRILFLQRSGGHAVANWICRQLDDAHHYLNDVCNPRTLELWSLRRPRIHAETEWLVYSVEDLPLEELPISLGRAGRYVPIGKDQSPVTILVLRDIRNFLASRHAYGTTHGGCHLGNVNRSVLTAWKQYASVYGYNMLGCGRKVGLDLVPVGFNQWATSRQYRQLLWAALSAPADGLPGDFTDAGIDDVVSWGCGSSFDALLYDGRAQDMDVLRRYRHIPDEILGLIDEQATELCQAIFGPWRW